MFYQNDQIHNNLYLVVWNCNEIGKVYQVIESGYSLNCYFKSYKQTHLGVRITVVSFITQWFETTGLQIYKFFEWSGHNSVTTV